MKVFAGLYDSFAISKSGILYIWGDNNLAELGNCDTTKPCAVEFPFAISTISPGYGFTTLLTKNGDVYNWGINSSGHLRDGTQKNHYAPQKISTLSQVQKLVSGIYHSLVLTKDGTVYSWGWNYYGQLGNGSIDNQFVPVQIPLPGKATDVATSGSTSYVKLEDGKVFAFGRNEELEIGSKYQEKVPTPVEVHYSDESLLFLPFKIKGRNPGYGKLEQEVRKGWQREMEM